MVGGKMNSSQFAGILIFCIGIVAYMLGLFSVFFAGKTFMPTLFSIGTLLITLGVAVILISLVLERSRDMKKDREMFSRMEGRK